MKHQLILFFLLAAFSWLPANAQFQTLVLHHTDGQTTEIELSEKPRMTFGTETVKILSKTLNLEYARKDVERFTFKANRIKVCSISGATLPVHLSMDGSNAILPLSTLPSDVCILTLNGKSFKLIKPKQ